MKRKLALLLAGVMALASVPMSLSAASDQKVTRTINAVTKTVFYEYQWASEFTGGNVKDTDNIDEGTSDIEHWVDGTSLRVTLNDASTSMGEEYELILNNADWFFRGQAKSKDDLIGGALVSSGILMETVSDVASASVDSNVESLVNYYQNKFGMVNITADAGNTFSAQTGSTPAVQYLSEVGKTKGTTAITANNIAATTTNGHFVVVAQENGSNVDLLVYKLTVLEVAATKSTLSKSGRYGSDAYLNKYSSSYITTANGFPANMLTTFNTANGRVFRNNDTATTVYENAVTIKSGVTDEIFYRMTISDSEKNKAYVEVLGIYEGGGSLSGKYYANDSAVAGDLVSPSKDDYFHVPLVMRTTSSGEYSVEIKRGNTNLSNAVVRIGSESAGKTNTYADGVVTNRADFDLDQLNIEELVAGTLKNETAFELRAPNGYIWQDPSKSDVTFYTSGGLMWATGSQGKMQTKNAVEIDFKQRSSKEDESILVVQINAGAITETNRLAGVLSIQNLTLYAEDEDRIEAGNEIKIDIVDMTSTYFKNTSSRRSVTDQTITVGKVMDYTIAIDVKEDVPKLISGRMYGASTLTSNQTGTDNIYDKAHKAAKVKIYENVVDAWWSNRTTKLVLPEEVSIMKAQFSKLNKFSDDTDIYSGHNTYDKNGDTYYNSRIRTNKVTVKNNTITMSNVQVKTDSKASFELDLWLSVRVDYEGDIDLTIAGTSVRDDYIDGTKEVSATIARAERPIEIETKVQEIKIGYQYTTVADFDITENSAGNLMNDHEVYISLTDGISQDVKIADTFSFEISEGDLKITNVSTNSPLRIVNGGGSVSNSGSITFEVDKSSSKASTISFSNVQVKTDRSTPYSNLSTDEQRGINLVAWGPGIAANYYYLYDQLGSTNNGGYIDLNPNLDGVCNLNDTFTTPGISVSYINVATIVERNTDGQITNIVKVPVGSETIYINDEEYTIPVPAYVSTASNSTMVPVRFVAMALGLDEEAVKWDPATSTVSVDAGQRVVQFQIGNTYYSVNGTSMPMVSPDGLPVAAEINGERAFIPFRQLGAAFGIGVSWDAATTTAIYNAPTVQ